MPGQCPFEFIVLAAYDGAPVARYDCMHVESSENPQLLGTLLLPRPELLVVLHWVWYLSVWRWAAGRGRHTVSLACTTTNVMHNTVLMRTDCR